MPTWFKWMICGVVLLVLAALHPHRGQLDTMGVVIGAGTLAWIAFGVLLAVRGTLRFLRR